MAVSFYDLSVGTYRQILGGLAAVLEKGAAHFKAHGVDPDAITTKCLFEDMRPLTFQVRAAAHNTARVLEAMKSGVYSPGPPEAETYSDLQAAVATALKDLDAWTPDAVNALQGGDIVIRTPRGDMAFTVEDFLLTFNLPNFYFHVTTAYDILRANGVPIGKMDFLGKMRMKG